MSTQHSCRKISTVSSDHPPKNVCLLMTFAGFLRSRQYGLVGRASTDEEDTAAHESKHGSLGSGYHLNFCGVSGLPQVQLTWVSPSHIHTTTVSVPTALEEPGTSGFS